MRALVLDPSSSKSSKDIDFPGFFLAILWGSLDSMSETSIEASEVKHPKDVERLDVRGGRSVLAPMPGSR